MNIAKKILKSLLPHSILDLVRFRITKKAITKKLAKRKMLDFQVHLVDHCNINCKGCNHFSNISDEKYHSLQSLENDFKRIYELTGEGRALNVVQLLGGEPLLHPNLIEILNIAGKYFTGADIRIVTNGLLLLKQESVFWETCRKNNIKIILTKYPINLPFDEIEETAKQYGTAFEYYENTGAVIKQLHKMPLNLLGTEDGAKSFELCYKANSCITLDEGKIYTCATIPYIKYFNKKFGKNLKVSDKDYIDIYTVKDIEEIFDFLCKPMPFCRYCNTKAPVYNIEWETSKKEISEYV